MKKVLGWLLLIPLHIVLLTITFFPIGYGFYKDDWGLAYWIYGGAIFIIISQLGFNLLEDVYNKSRRF